MERNIRSEVDIFLNNLKIGIILQNADKIRDSLSQEMPKIQGINNLKEAMQLHKLAYQVLKEENNNVSKEMGVIAKSRQLNSAMMSSSKDPICKFEA